MSVDIFISYAHKDKVLRDQLAIQLSNLRNQNVIDDWFDGDIIPGTEWRKQIQQHLESAQVILLLISSDFMASEFCYSKEMLQAVERHKEGKARVLPILLRPTDYEGGLFADIAALPSNGVPISRWANIDAALHDVIRGIRQAVRTIFPENTSESKTDSKLLSQAPPLIWNVPFAHNPYFTGREKVLNLLCKRLNGRNPRPQVICGLGGIGKTQTVLEYAYRYGQDYQYVLWVQANTPEQLSTNFAGLANVLKLFSNSQRDQDESIEEVKDWLQHHGKWLLILDNADDLNEVFEILPRFPRGHVLLTSRSQILPSHMQEQAQVLRLGNMSTDEGIRFLLHRSMLLDQEEELESFPDNELEMALRIVDLLDGLPLALAQAGAYINSTKCGLSGYVRRYEKNANRLLHEEKGLTPEHPNPVATTWSLSLQSLEKANPAATDLLRLCAFLHADAIPQKMITEGAKGLLPGLNVGPGSSNFNKAVEDLLTYSLMSRDTLVSRDTRIHTLSVHPLVQIVLREGLGEEEQRLWAERAVTVVSRGSPSVDSTNWLNYEPFFPHGQICVDWIEHWHLILPEAARVLNQVGRYLEERGSYAKVEHLYQYALYINERQERREDSEIAHCLNNLARLHMKLGQYRDAESLAQRALHINEQRQETEDSEKADTLNNLAEPYREQGKFEQAEPLYQQALRILQRQLDPSHPNTAVILNNLAALYREQGKFDQAEPLYQRALSIQEQELGPSHPSTAASLNNLAALYREQGKFERAEPLLQRALSIQEQELGPSHPDTAASLSNLAALYHAQGRYREAELLYQRALYILEEQLGLQHPITQTLREDYADLLRRMGRNEEAKSMEATS